MVGLGQNMLDVADYVRHNDLGTAVLLRELAAGGFKGRLVLASSMVVYGEGGYRCAPARREPAGSAGVAPTSRPGGLRRAVRECGLELEPVAIEESAPLDPRSVYAATKVQQEHLCFAFSRETGIPVTALRYHNVYGPRMPRDTPYAGVAAIFASALAAGRSAAGVRGRRATARLRPCARRRTRKRDRADRRAADCGRVQCRQRKPAQRRRDGRRRSRPRRGPEHRQPIVTGEFRLGDVRHVFASARRAERLLGFRAPGGLRSGDGGVRESPRCAPLDRARVRGRRAAADGRTDRCRDAWRCAPSRRPRCPRAAWRSRWRSRRRSSARSACSAPRGRCGCGAPI